MQARRQSIPILLLIKTGFQLLWQQRDDGLRLGIVPVLVVFGGYLYASDALIAFITAVQQGAADAAAVQAGRVLFLGLLVLVAFSLLSVNWLRFLLLGPMGAIGIGLNIGAAHIGFVVALFGLVAATMAALTLGGIVLGLLPPAVAMLGNLLLFAGAMVVNARFVPFLVGKAIGQALTLRQSWTVSRGHALAIAMAVILVQVPFVIGLALLHQILAVTGFAAVAPAATSFIDSTVQVADWICQAGVLATAYRHLVGVRV